VFRKEKTVITAVDFLHMYLEFNTMTSAKKDWTKPKLAKSPPWLNRLLRLEALIKAFGLRTKLVDFHKGHWIDFENSAYDVFLDAAGAEILENPVEQWDTKQDRHRLQRVFELLLQYRINLEKSLDPGGVVLCRDGAGLYADRKISALDAIIEQNLFLVEEPLATIISPENRSFQVTNLAREYGYPDVDLDELDLDWIA